MDSSIMDFETSTRFWEEIQDLIFSTPPLSTLNGIESPRVQEDNVTAGLGQMNTQGSESESSSTFSPTNNDTMSILSSPQQNEFHKDEEMLGYDLEVFGLRWKLENIQGIHQDEIRMLKVLVPYDNDGLPVYTKIENNIVADNNQEEKQENTNSEENCNSVENVPSVPSGNDSETSVPDEPVFANKESEIKTEIILPRPELMDAEIHTGCVVKALESGKTASNIDVIPLKPDNNMKIKKLESRTIKCFTSVGGPSADTEWEKKFIAKKSFNPSMSVHKGEEVVFKDNLKSAEYNFVCEFCNQGYNQKYKWRSHVQIHCGDVTYKCNCPNCKVPYRDFRTMRKHHNDRTRKMM